MKLPTITNHFVIGAVEGARRIGLDVNNILLSAGLTPAVLEQPQARVSADKYTKLIQTLWLEMKDEFMGFGERPCKLGAFATMSYAVIHCKNLEQLFKRSTLFYSLITDSPGLRIELTDNDAILRLIHDENMQDHNHFMSNALLMIWHRFACWTVGKYIPLKFAKFNYPEPEFSQEYNYLYHCPLKFDASAIELVFHKKYLDLPIVQTEQSLDQFLINSPAELLAKPGNDDSATAHIRGILSQGDLVDFPDFETIAQHLNSTPQTLRRRLKEEGSSYQEIKDDIRRDAAIYFLGQRQLNINQIAEKIGFSEPSTFHRAFKKWTGVTPGAYRQGEGR